MPLSDPSLLSSSLKVRLVGITIAFALALAFLIPRAVFERDWQAAGGVILLGAVYYVALRLTLSGATEPDIPSLSPLASLRSMSDMRGYAVVLDPSQPHILYTLAGSLQTPAALFRSENGGDTWDRLHTPGENPYLTGIAIDPTPPHPIYVYSDTQRGGICKTHDGGEQWTAAYQFQPSHNTKSDVAADANLYFSRVIVHPTHPQLLYAGVRGYSGQHLRGVVSSTDGGTSWAARSSGLPEVNVSVLDIDPLQPHILYAAIPDFSLPQDPTQECSPLSTSLLFQSQDGGEKWAQIRSDLAAGPILTLKKSPLPPFPLYTSIWGKGVFRSLDNGGHWEQMDQLEFQSTALLNIRDIILGPSQSDFLYVRGEQVSISADAGRTWECLTRDVSAKQIADLAVHPTDPATLYIATDAGLFRTTDFGQHWQAINTGLASW